MSHVRAGEWKYLKSAFGFRSFPHFVVNGGNENVGKWFREKVRLDEMYRSLWGDPTGARLIELALFCDGDNTGGDSVAYFSNVRMADTDGIDGSEANAGACFAPEALNLAASRGLRADKLLAANEAYGFFEASGGLITTGPTRTNVNDYRVVLIV